MHEPICCRPSTLDSRCYKCFLQRMKIQAFLILAILAPIKALLAQDQDERMSQFNMIPHYNIGVAESLDKRNVPCPKLIESHFQKLAVMDSYQYMQSTSANAVYPAAPNIKIESVEQAFSLSLKSRIELDTVELEEDPSDFDLEKSYIEFLKVTLHSQFHDETKLKTYVARIIQRALFNTKKNAFRKNCEVVAIHYPRSQLLEGMTLDAKEAEMIGNQYKVSQKAIPHEAKK